MFQLTRVRSCVDLSSLVHLRALAAALMPSCSNLTHAGSTFTCTDGVSLAFNTGALTSRVVFLVSEPHGTCTAHACA